MRLSWSGQLEMALGNAAIWVVANALVIGLCMKAGTRGRKVFDGCLDVHILVVVPQSSQWELAILSNTRATSKVVPQRMMLLSEGNSAYVNIMR